VASIVNHLGHCVTDLERSRRFYEAVLDFEYWHELAVPDEAASPLLQLPAPLATTAVYLRRGDFVLELMHYAAPGAQAAARQRIMNEIGFTHLSVSVDDIDATAAKAVEYGGEVVEGTHLGMVVMIRDPDGQLLELLPMDYRDRLPD
jgi:lactoylglutathione lyase